ncbi:MAG: hypothetical protein ACP5N2_06265 [Candidatus Nanoarchaeia archaeon]
MGLFSKKKEEEKEVIGKSENVVPGVLPDTIMQRLSVAQNSQKEIIPQKFYTEDVKSKLQEKYVHEKLPDDMAAQSKDKGPERHEIEKVLMIRNSDIDRDKAPEWERTGLGEKKYSRQNYDIDESRFREREVHRSYKSILPDEQKESRSERKEDSLSPGVQAHKHHWPSFFVELERMLLSRKHHAKHVAAQDLISRMKEYHDSKNTGDVYFMHEFEIEEQIVNSLSMLKDLEADWLHTKKQVSSVEKILFEKEHELENRLADFKLLLLSAERFKAYNLIAQDSQVFFLSDGMKIYSVQQLIDEIPKMKEDVFAFHVTPQRNDFACWIRGVFKLEELSLKVAEAMTKEQMLQVLKGK